MNMQWQLACAVRIPQYSGELISWARANPCDRRSAETVTLSKGPFTHTIFDVISDAISHTKRALPYPAQMRGLESKLSHII